MNVPSIAKGLRLPVVERRPSRLAPNRDVWPPLKQVPKRFAYLGVAHELLQAFQICPCINRQKLLGGSGDSGKADARLPLRADRLLAIVPKSRRGWLELLIGSLT